MGRRPRRPLLEATRPHLELYRASLEERGLAASTIDRRLSKACGFYRFADIDGHLGVVRTFLERIIDWDWQDAPRRVPIFAGDIPKATSRYPSS